ncbi:hypothetical protein ANN_22444 [Periplaneta americana]|uniref:Reverse transcriptase domain-containing protein n=1 Tax=Periplaneta americana TaxID=6978 RepID=A0ABQ8S8G4_PERAM|nr:hypothetical protein ANN_22444 [Periplaneta americana]
MVLRGFLGVLGILYGCSRSTIGLLGNISQYVCSNRLVLGPLKGNLGFGAGACWHPSSVGTDGRKRELQSQFSQHLKMLDPESMSSIRMRVEDELRDKYAMQGIGPQPSAVFEPKKRASIQVEGEGPSGLPLGGEKQIEGIDRTQFETEKGKLGSESRLFSSDVNQCHMKIYLDLFKNLRLTDGKNPRLLMGFLMEIIGIHALGLVEDREFILGLMPQTSGLLLEIFGRAIQFQWSWSILLERVVLELLPSQLREDLVRDYLSRRFQFPEENSLEFLDSLYRPAFPFLSSFNYLHFALILPTLLSAVSDGDIIVGSACIEDLTSGHSSDYGWAAERILGTPGFYSALLEPLHFSTCKPSWMLSGVFAKLDPHVFRTCRLLDFRLIFLHLVAVLRATAVYGDQFGCRVQISWITAAGRMRASGYGFQSMVHRFWSGSSSSRCGCWSAVMRCRGAAQASIRPLGIGGLRCPVRGCGFHPNLLEPDQPKKQTSTQIGGNGSHNVHLGFEKQVEASEGIETAPSGLGSGVPEKEKSFLSDVNQCHMKIYLDLVKNIHVVDGKDARLLMRGNYVELLKEFGDFDVELPHHLSNSTVFSGLSSGIQNDIIFSVSQLITEEMKKEISDTPFVGIIMDEAMDYATKSQLSVILRYVTKAGNIEERFLYFRDVSDDRTANSLAHHVFNVLHEFNCETKLVSHTYDGAAVMSGKQEEVGIQKQSTVLEVLSTVHDFDFNVLLNVFYSIFPQADILFQVLQKKAFDIEFCSKQVEKFSSHLTKLREDFESIWDKVSYNSDKPVPSKRLRIDAISGESRSMSYKRIFLEVIDIPPTQRSRRNTALTIPFRLYEFNKLPMGIAVGSQILSREIDCLFGDIKCKYVFNYADNLLIYSPMREEHECYLKEVFNRLQQADITLNKEKITLGAVEIKFLGHQLSARGIGTDPMYGQFPRPTNVKQVCRFVGMARFYSKYVKKRKETYPNIEIRMTLKCLPSDFQCFRGKNDFRILVEMFKNVLRCYAPFKAYYVAAVNSWNKQNPGRVFSIYEVAACINIVHQKAMTPTTIKNGFRKCGIFPFNRNIFTEDDFLMIAATFIEYPNATDTNNTAEEQTVSATYVSIMDSPNRVEKTRRPHEKGRCLIAIDTPEKKKIQEKAESVALKKSKNQRKLFPKIRDEDDKNEEELAAIWSDTSSDGGLEFVNEDPEINFGELSHSPKEGDFILVEFKTKASIFYVGNVLKEADSAGIGRPISSKKAEADKLCAKLSSYVEACEDGTVTCCDSNSDIDSVCVNEDFVLSDALSELADSNNKIDIEIIKYIVAQKDQLISELREKVDLLTKHVNLLTSVVPQGNSTAV